MKSRLTVTETNTNVIVLTKHTFNIVDNTVTLTTDELKEIFGQEIIDVQEV